MSDKTLDLGTGKKDLPSNEELEKITVSVEKQDAKPLKEVLDSIDSYEKRREVLNLVKSINERHRSKESSLPTLEIVSKVPVGGVLRSSSLTTTLETKNAGQIKGKIIYMETLDLHSLKRTSTADPSPSDAIWIRNH
ncbi:MAG: hypothetical protein K2X27_23380 [Candidatus Obscuribacterales bacterium]|nr:hypothetical protein [Candidatus Obscuribacterales bacterium]